MKRNMPLSAVSMAAATLALCTLALPAAAQSGCVWSDIVTDTAQAATVKAGAARTYFVKDAIFGKGCPDDRAACRDKAYLTPGDAVLTGPVRGAFTCVGFSPLKGMQTISWMPSAALSPLPVAEQKPVDLTGNWVAPEQSLVITTTDGGKLAVKGGATWGDSDARRRAMGAIHTGEVSGTARPENGILAFTMGETETLPYDKGDDVDCRIRIQRRGPYLLVRDNNQCGGVNVSFSGFYRRKG